MSPFLTNDKNRELMTPFHIHMYSLDKWKVRSSSYLSKKLHYGLSVPILVGICLSPVRVCALLLLVVVVAVVATAVEKYHSEWWRMGHI